MHNFILRRTCIRCRNKTPSSFVGVVKNEKHSKVVRIDVTLGYKPPVDSFSSHSGGISVRVVPPSLVREISARSVLGV